MIILKVDSAKTCTSCKHFISHKPKWMNIDSPYTKPCTDCDLFVDAITGDTVPVNDVRADGIFCGQSGKYWEAKE